jgi:predicted MFS family arabinose efflux permease
VSKNSPSPWLILFSLCLYTFSVSITNGAIPPVISILVRDLGISYAEAGLLMTIFCLPGIFLIIPLSFLSNRFKLRDMGLLSMAVILAGSLMLVATDNYVVMLLGRLVGGLGWSLQPVVGLQAVTKWFMGKRLGLAMGIFNTFVFIALITALNTFGAVGEALGWKAVVWITIGAMAVTLVVFALFFKEPESHGEKVPIAASDVLKLGWPVWLIGISWGLFSFGIASMFTFLTDLFYEKGFTLGIAGSMTSIIIICTAILSPFTGYILDRIKHKQIFVVVGAAVSSIFVFLLPLHVNFAVAILIAIGITTAPFVTVFMTTAPSLVQPQHIGLAFGLITTINTVGSFVGPYIFGSIRDATQSYEAGYKVVAVLFVLIAVLIGFSMLRETRKARNRL